MAVCRGPAQLRLEITQDFALIALSFLPDTGFFDRGK
jgi:hypothetical protein